MTSLIARTVVVCAWLLAASHAVSGDGPLVPTTVVECLQRGQLSFGQGDWDGAEKEYLAAQEALPGYFSTLDHLGELRAAQRRFPEAVSLYQEAIRQTERPEFMQSLGDVYAFSGDATNARAWHDRALAGYLKRVGEGDTSYDRFLAGFYSDVQPEPAEALRWAQRGIEEDLGVYAYDALAWALYQNGRWAEAAEAARQALAPGTLDAHLLYRAGMILSRAGDLAQGGKLLREVSAVNPRYFNTFHVHR